MHPVYVLCIIIQVNVQTVVQKVLTAAFQSAREPCAFRVISFNNFTYFLIREMLSYAQSQL